MLEANEHVENSFVTLTYGVERREVEPEDLQKWLKRFRRRIAPRQVRYFAVGEYGDVSGRPHYHAALFGWPSCSLDYAARVGECGCLGCSVVRETWGFGHVLVGQLNMGSANYIAGYVTKKMTSVKADGLSGRHPEFARMSLRPGIGANAMEAVALAMMRHKLDRSEKDVPTGLRHGKEVLRLGRYLRRRLREEIGRDPSCPVSFGEEELRAVRSYAFCVDKSVASVFSELAGISPPYVPRGEI